MNSLLNTFDDFVDDLISSDADLLKGELDILLFQNLFQSIDLRIMKNIQFEEEENLAA